MEAEMTKADVLERIQEAYRALDGVLSQLSPEQMQQKGVEGEWSAKDMIAHIAEWDRRLASWLEEIQRGTLPRQAVDWSDADEINDQIFHQNKDRPVDAVLADFKLTHQATLDAVSRLPDEMMENSPHFDEYPDFDLRELIGWETWEHYDEHGEAISEWARGHENS
jgi:hypothetical protein